MEKCFVLIENNSPMTSLSLAEYITIFDYQCVLVLDERFDIPDKSYPFVIKRISNFNEKKLKNIACEIKEKYRIVGITSAFGFFYEGGLLPATVSDIAKDLGLKHTPSSALIQSSNKFLMRSCLKKNNVYTTRFSLADSLDSLISSCKHVKFPVLLKPVVGLGSSFIYKCNNLLEAKTAFEHYLNNVENGYYSDLFKAHSFQGVNFNPKKQLLVEEFLDGPELSVELLCTDSEIIPLLVHDKLDVEEGAYCSFENLLITPPVRLNEELVKETEQYAIDIAKVLGLKNCFCHVELRIHNGKPAVMEINHRIGGMRVEDTLKSRLGIEHNDILIKLLSGQSIAPLEKKDECRDYLGMCAVYTRKSGTLKNVKGLKDAKNIKGIKNISQHVPTGYKVGGDFEETFVVTAWFKADSEEKIREIDQRIKELITFEVESA
ncbi:ATP-grasp domain-containing protein [Candidatus Sororendozoicomonas aggregata]|uniref:ATP-grasp domain-containing protein n=1 Tax=Candidatus Sororendozoicomonas aggregata TaxID=3073239 RepID=UPI002ED19F79